MQVDDTISKNSSFKGSNKHSGGSNDTSKTKKEAASDRKKLKVLKTALREERLAREEQSIELNAVKIRNLELEKEYSEINNKYLAIYEENDKLQEQIQTLQYKMSSGSTGEKAGMDEKSGGLVDFFKSGKAKEMEQARE